MGKRPLKATDKRRNSKGGFKDDSDSENGSGKPLAGLFHDRRKNNGHGKRAG